MTKRRQQGKAKKKGTWGGARPGAGRKPKGPIAVVSHRPRAARKAGQPSHVLLKLRPGLPSLQRAAEHDAIRTALASGKERFGFRLCHYAVLPDQLQLIVEASASGDALRRGMQGLAVRVARALNRLWQLSGKVYADRFRDRVLATPRAVHDALAALFAAAGAGANARDTYSSAPWFDGFREPVAWRDLDSLERPTADARSRLLRTEWRRHGLL